MSKKCANRQTTTGSHEQLSTVCAPLCKGHWLLYYIYKQRLQGRLGDYKGSSRSVFKATIAR